MIASVIEADGQAAVAVIDSIRKGSPVEEMEAFGSEETI
jgi:hypothetical protein